MPLVDRVVADRLPDEVVRDRPDPQAVPLEDLAAPRHVVVLGQGAVHLEVVAPAGDLEPVVPPGGGQPAHLLEGQVGPLSGEQGDRSCHGVLQMLLLGRFHIRRIRVTSCLSRVGRKPVPGPRCRCNGLPQAGGRCRVTPTRVGRHAGRSAAQGGHVLVADPRVVERLARVGRAARGVVLFVHRVVVALGAGLRQERRVVDVARSRTAPSRSRWAGRGASRRPWRGTAGSGSAASATTASGLKIEVTVLPSAAVYAVCLYFATCAQ